MTDLDEGGYGQSNDLMGGWLSILIKWEPYYKKDWLIITNSVCENVGLDRSHV